MRNSTSKPQNFECGDVVMLNSGGPHMTVIRQDEEHGVYCVWHIRVTHDEHSADKGTSFFPPACLTRIRDVNAPAENAEVSEGKPSDALRDAGAPRGTFTANARCPRCMKAMRKEIPFEARDFPLSCCGHEFAIASFAVACRGV